MFRQRTLMLALAAAAWTAPSAWAQGQAFPFFASVKKGEVNVRSGPGNQYPILWVYQRPGYPVQVQARYDNYYKLRDAEGEEGWVYIGMISRKKTGLVGGQHPVALYRDNNAGSDVLARLAPGVVVSLEDHECAGDYCEVSVDGYDGWVAKTTLLMVQ